MEPRSRTPPGGGAPNVGAAVDHPYAHATWRPALRPAVARAVCERIDTGTAWVRRQHEGWFDFCQLDLGDAEESVDALLDRQTLEDLRVRAGHALRARLGAPTHVEAHVMGPGDYLAWHTDSPRDPSVTPPFRVVIVLTSLEDVAGGVFGLRPSVPCDQVVEYPPAFNTAYAFQLDLFREHCVTEVTAGRRRSVVVGFAAA